MLSYNDLQLLSKMKTIAFFFPLIQLPQFDTNISQKMVDWRTKASITDIANAINGRIRRHHRDMLRYHWDHMSYLEKAIEELEKQIDQLLSPYRKEVELLDGIPGMNKAAAATFIAEMGVDMSVFKSAKLLASWAGVSPGNYESAGKKKTSKTTQGNKALKNDGRRVCISNIKAK